MTRRKHRLPMSAPMVRAIEREIEAPGAGKTQTRRLVRPQPEKWEHAVGLSHIEKRWGWNAPDGAFLEDLHYDWPAVLIACAPIQTGDLIAFTEAWAVDGPLDQVRRESDDIMLPCSLGHGPYYRADGQHEDSGLRWRSSLFMPYWCSRYTGVVTDVRGERVQEISEADARDEGITEEQALSIPYGRPFWAAFSRLWEDTNGPGAWERNDWVYVYTFRPIAANVLHVEHDPAAYGVGEGA